MKCNKDCFHCSFPDCINDAMTLDEFHAASDKRNQKKSTYYD